MKRLASALIAGALLLTVASAAMSAVGWCGNVWPVNGTPYTSADNIGVYVQVWKDGCTNTDPAAPCPDIEARLFWRCTGDAAFNMIPMVYNVDVGSNDEFTATIPAGHGCSEIEFYCEVEDITDFSLCYGQDQNNNDPNFFLPITEVTSQDVVVTFHLCLPDGIDSFFDVCVTGNHDELTNWGDGVVMGQPCPGPSPKLYQVDVNFLEGSNPYVEYKYKKDDCATWESTGNHSFTIDDSSPYMDLPWIDGWEYMEPDCPDCASPVEEATWGMIKGLYR
jgi:hypothetical protein